MSTEPLVAIPLPLEGGGVTYAVARLIDTEDGPVAEAIVAIPGTTFAPPRRIALSRYSLSLARPGAALRPDLYVYEGMILPPPKAAH
ncbi:MAG: hypothetical protein HXY28_05470 [Hydrogenophilaceae bacterium]|nr:hypothetical protein [Hydrogenophilaceae bacterium]